MKNKVVEKAIETGANIAGGLAAVPFADMIFPGASLLGAVVGPVVTSVTGDIAKRALSHSENSRFALVSENLVDKIKRKMDAGYIPRQDDFYTNDEYGQSSASKLLEEMLLKCKQEFEAKKLDYYSNFWENICFENGVSYETANSLISQFSALSYQQIKILMYLNTGVSIPVGKWEKYMFRYDVLAPYYSLYSDSLHLYNIRLAAQPEAARGVIQLGTPEICISPSGKLMCQLLELSFRDNEYEEMTSYISNVDAIVDRLMAEANDDGSDRILDAATKADVNALIDEKKDEIIEAATPKWQ